MNARTAQNLRGELARTSAGVLWCHTADYPALDHLLHRVAASKMTDIVRVLVTPTDRARPTTLATDVAMALGIVPAAAGQSRGEVRMDQLVPPLLLRPGAHLLLGSAWWTHIDSLADLSVATRAGGATIWLLGTDPLPLDVKTLLIGLGDPVDAGTVLAAFGDVTGAPIFPIAKDSNPWSTIERIPTSDFVTFLADVRKLMTPQAAAVVESTLLAEHAGATAWLSEHPDAATPMVAAALHERWDSCVSWQEFLTRIRAWQIAAFHSGKLLKVSPHQLAGTASAVPSARQRTAEQWASLRAWHEPNRAAACALVAAGIGAQEAVAVTLADVDPDGGTVRVAGRGISIETPARCYLQAARYGRLLCGAGPTDRLLTTQTGQEFKPRWVATQATSARTNFGLPLASSGISSRTTTGDRWASRWGLTMIELQ